jgi:hypothetical protein
MISASMQYVCSIDTAFDLSLYGISKALLQYRAVHFGFAEFCEYCIFSTSIFISKTVIPAKAGIFQ